MNIQSYIDRKREAGRKEHEGNSTDWAGWTREQFLAAIAGELLDACAYAQKLDFEKRKYGEETGNSIITGGEFCRIYDVMQYLPVSALEAACQEAEQEAENG